MFQAAQKLLPIDSPVAGRQMIVVGADVITGLNLEDARRESIRACLPGEASTVKVEHSGASNTFTARSEPYNRDEIYACPINRLAVSFI